MAASSRRSVARKPRASGAPATKAKQPRPEVAAAPARVLYEHPLNERVRTFLRLEFLFRQAGHHLAGKTDWDSRATLNCILEILAIFGNTNLKSEVLKELERTASSLKRLEQNPGVDHNMLSALLAEISQKMDAMHRIDGQIASSLKTSEFIASIRQRSAIPGGTCDFDLPAYHFWLQQPMEQRSRDLAEWLGHFDAIGQSIQLVMKLTRDSTPLKPVTAPGGLYQRTLDTSQPYQLIRIALPEGSPWFAETSGGRHRFTVRFLTFSTVEDRASQANGDIAFELACCAL